MIRIDPKIPDCFYSMDIDDMPKEVIDEWYRKPYIQTRGNSFAVMCLDGGAWDRPTIKELYGNIEDAEKWINIYMSLMFGEEEGVISPNHHGSVL